MQLPFFGMLSTRSPLNGLREHYDTISECLALVGDSLTCFVTEGPCRSYTELAAQMDALESRADKIKRKIRNKLPRNLFMPVDKTLFLEYTTAQDNVLDAAQECIYWLAMRPVTVPVESRDEVLDFLENVFASMELLGPALQGTLGFVTEDRASREAVKESLREVRRNHRKVSRMKFPLIAGIYKSGADFYDVYQLIHVIFTLHDMSHNSRRCAELLRAMIAR
jgi:predicted phosphate transport protein (TIGR00153 family)